MDHIEVRRCRLREQESWMTQDSLVWMEEKVLGQLTKSLNTKGEARFEEEDVEFDFGHIES